MTTHTAILWFSGFCPGQPRWAGTRRNIYPLTPIMVINHPLSASSIYHDPWHPSCSTYVLDSLFTQCLSKFSLVYLLAWHLPLHTPYISKRSKSVTGCCGTLRNVTKHYGALQDVTGRYGKLRKRCIMFGYLSYLWPWLEHVGLDTTAALFPGPQWRIGHLRHNQWPCVFRGHALSIVKMLIMITNNPRSRRGHVT